MNIALNCAVGLIAVKDEFLRPKQIYNRLADAYFPLAPPLKESSFYEMLRSPLVEKKLALTKKENWGQASLYALSSQGIYEVTQLLKALSEVPEYNGDELLFICAACTLWEYSPYDKFTTLPDGRKKRTTHCRARKTCVCAIKYLDALIISEEENSLKTNTGKLERLKLVQELLRNACRTSAKTNRIRTAE